MMAYWVTIQVEAKNTDGDWEVVHETAEEVATVTALVRLLAETGNAINMGDITLVTEEN